MNASLDVRLQLWELSTEHHMQVERIIYIFVGLTLSSMGEGGGGGACFFCPLLEISLVNPYLKFIDLKKLFIADAPMKKK